MHISWVEHFTNNEVLRRMNKRTTKCNLKKENFLFRPQHEKQLLKLIMERKRGPGRRECSWLKNIKHWTGLNSPYLNQNGTRPGRIPHNCYQLLLNGNGTRRKRRIHSLKTIKRSILN